MTKKFPTSSVKKNSYLQMNIFCHLECCHSTFYITLILVVPNDFHKCCNYSPIYIIGKMKLCQNIPRRNISFIQHYLIIAQYKIYVWFSCEILKKSGICSTVFANKVTLHNLFCNMCMYVYLY